ncbi:unnamed protein product [Brassica napus]|uniref:(rape) hypothetical protein n=3 Tax=Brassica TaxID=3705 RepID=A0A816PCV6_BRANA|nr:unnamed protein product [Brassica napus]
MESEMFASDLIGVSSYFPYLLPCQVLSSSSIMDAQEVAAALVAALAAASPLQLAWVTDRFLLGDAVSVSLFVKSLIMPLTEGEKKTLASNLIRIPPTVNHHRFDL